MTNEPAYDEIPPSREVMFESIRRNSAELSTFDLDEQLAMAVARRDVAAAHKRATSAATWNDLAIMLADMRETRVKVAREVERLTGPSEPLVRPLTAEELAETQFDDDTPEPSC